MTSQTAADHCAVLSTKASSSEQHPLVAKLTQHLQSNAPVLCHINADTSWLILVPIPEHHRSSDGRLYSKILIDPWLEGPQVDYFIWFSVQHHVIPSCVRTIQELEAVLQAVEKFEKAISRADGNISTGSASSEQDSSLPSRPSAVDLVIISHEFTDHCHKATLTQLHRSVRIVAASAACKLIKSWTHFDDQKITEMPEHTAFVSPPPLKGVSSSADDLPPGVNITRLFTPRDLPQKGFHAGVYINFMSGPQGLRRGIVYTPHGLTPEAVHPVTKDRSYFEPRTLALLHGRVKMSLGYGLMPLNFGGEQGAKVAKALRARYWFGTHEEEKKAAGGVSYLLRRKTMPTKAAAQRSSGGGSPEFRELGSGEVFCLLDE